MTDYVAVTDSKTANKLGVLFEEMNFVADSCAIELPAHPEYFSPSYFISDAIERFSIKYTGEEWEKRYEEMFNCSL